MPLPPLTFTPILKQRAWGGQGLAAFGKAITDEQVIGESWEIADLPTTIAEGRSIVEGGPLDGCTLHGLIERDPEGILGRAAPGPGGGFPLLVKLLDAQENLSVQLHPSESYARRNPEAYRKTEAWVVLGAEPGAVVHVGLKDEVNLAMFEAGIRSGEIESMLRTFPVGMGDCIYLESGLCHALGAGLLVAEIQLPSDTTFRVWDWNRDDPDRPLHLDQAIESIRTGSEQEAAWPVLTRPEEARTSTADGISVACLVDSPSFRIERFTPDMGLEQTVSFAFPTNDMPHVFLVEAGTVMIESGGQELRLDMGRSALLPAGAETAMIHLEVRDNTRASLIHAAPPDPLDNVRA